MEPRATGSGITQDFTVGPWYIRPSFNLITSEKRSTQLEPKVMQMLVILAEHAGDVVSRDELHEQLWTDAIVTDKALTRLASELRKAFGDDPREPSIIATISKSGYRLVAPVSFVSPGDGSLQVSDPSVVTILSPSVRTPPSPVPKLVWILGGAAVLTVGLFAGMLLSDSDGGYEPALQLTAFPGHEISPALSPDGNEVAFSWQGEPEDNWDIYVKQPGSDGLLRLTDHPGDDLHPTWSPDGTKIAFARYDESTCSINWVPALSGPVRFVATCEWIEEDDRPYRTSSIDWSPDGKSLAASQGGIYLIDVQTGEQTEVTHPPENAIADINPVFAPDGETIAFARIRPLATADLFRVSVGEGLETQLTDEARLILGHEWTNDGQHLLFSSNRGGRFGLWKVAATGGKPTAVPADGWNIEKVSVALEGDRIAYEGWIYDTNIWRVSTDSSGSREQVIASTLWDRHPAISPDGSRIAFVSNRSGSWEIWLAGADGSAQTQLTQLGGPVVGVPRWSPDGSRIAIQVQDASGADIRIVDTATGGVDLLTNDPSDDAAPSWSSTGERVYFGSNRSGTWQIWSKSVAGGEANQVTEHGGYAAQASPDGRFLFVTRDDTAGLWRLAPHGGTATRILDYPARGDWGNFSVGSDGIYVLQRRRTDGPPILLLTSFDGSETSEVIILDPAPTPHHPGLSVAPDGKSVLITLVDDTESDLFVMRLGDG